MHSAMIETGIPGYISQAGTASFLQEHQIQVCLTWTPEYFTKVAASANMEATPLTTENTKQ